MLYDKTTVAARRGGLAMAAVLALLLCRCSNKNQAQTDCAAGGSCTTIPACAAACNSTCQSRGNTVSGPPDSHCTTKQAVDMALCTGKSLHRDLPLRHDGHEDNGGASPTPSGSPGPADNDGGSDHASHVLFNDEGDDDDCKYHVKFSATPLCRNNDIFFIVKVQKLADGTIASGAKPYLELFKTNTQELPTDTTPDASPTSPHSHVGFHLNIP